MFVQSLWKNAFWALCTLMSFLFLLGHVSMFSQRYILYSGTCFIRFSTQGQKPPFSSQRKYRLCQGSFFLLKGIIKTVGYRKSVILKKCMSYTYLDKNYWKQLFIKKKNDKVAFANIWPGCCIYTGYPACSNLKEFLLLLSLYV